MTQQRTTPENCMQTSGSTSIGLKIGGNIVLLSETNLFDRNASTELPYIKSYRLGSGHDPGTVLEVCGLKPRGCLSA
jgi:hypothetical protein